MFLDFCLFVCFSTENIVYLVFEDTTTYEGGQYRKCFLHKGLFIKVGIILPGSSTRIHRVRKLHLTGKTKGQIIFLPD